MKISELVFVGIKGSVIALNRHTGVQDFVNVVVEDEKVFAATYGEVYCLDPLTGNRLWHNQLRGFGIGLATLATSAASDRGLTPLMAEKRRRDQESAD